MLVSNNEHPVEKVGVQKEQSFTIKASAKAFEILSSTIYSDIVKAIIRELSTNAYDSHVAAKNTDRTFDVHLPTTLEPYFEIRDYGTGLSEEEVFQVFCSYFESTKTESNDYIGCLGLGSKTPFAYSKNFTIKSFYQGVEYIYAAFVGEDRFPKMSLLHKQATNEPNGLLINLSVQSKDIQNFCWKAEEVYSYFQVKPNLTGAKIDMNDELVTMFDFKSGAIVKKHDHGYDRFVVCVMGNIGYKVGVHSFVSERYFLQLKFNIGDLDISANRETLQLSDEVYALINKKIEEVRAEFDAFHEVEKAKLKTEWEQWKYDLEISAILNNRQNKHFIITPTYDADGAPGIGAEKEEFYVSGWRGSTRKVSKGWTRYLQDREEQYLIVGPISDNYGRAYLRELNKDRARLIVITPENETDLKARGVPDAMFLEKKNIAKVSIIAKPRSTPKRPKITRKLQDIKGVDHNVPVDKDVYYVIGTRDEVTSEKYTIQKWINSGLITNDEFNNIYFLTNNRRDILELTKWIPIREFKKEILNRVTEEDKLVMGALSRFYDHDNKIGKILANSTLDEAQKLSEYLAKGQKNREKYNWLSGNGATANTILAQKLEKAVYARYPLLEYLSMGYSCGEVTMKHIINYIKLVDSTF